MPTAKRDLLLNNILKQNDWIIEGVYYAWLGDSFKKADRIFVLNIPRHIYRKRIILRFIKRKIGLEHGKNETLASLKALLKWTDKYMKINMVQIRCLLAQYDEKVIWVKSSKDLKKYLKSL